MAVPSGLKDPKTEHEPGNAEDTLNPGDAHYRQDIAKQESGDDQDWDKTLADNDYSTNRDKTKVDSHGDVIQRNEKAEPEADRQAIENAEQNPEFPYRQTGSPKAALTGWRGRLRGQVTKLGPTGSVIGILLFGIIGLGGGSSFLASSLMINIKEIFHNDRADATRTNRIFGRATTSNMFNNKGDCKKKTPICTKMSTMGAALAKDYVKNGDFKIKGTVVDKDGNPTGDSIATDEDLDKLDDTKRIQLESVEYPDGTVVRNGKELYAHADGNSKALRRLETAFASRASYYTNKFFTNVLGQKFKFTKAQPKYPEGDDDEARKKQNDQFDSEGQFKTDAAAKETEALRITDDAANKTNSGKEEGNSRGKGGAVGTVFRGVCTAYDLAKIAETGIKVYHMGELVRFALLFFRAADQIKDQKGDAPLVWRLSDRLTYADRNPTTADGKPNPKYNLSATDSEGYQIAAHGSVMALKAFSEQYILGGGIGKKIDGFTSLFEDTAAKVPGVSGDNGRAKVKSMCRIMTGNAASLIAACAGLPAAAQVLGSTVPAVGNIIAGVISGVGCICTAGNITEQAARDNIDIIGDILGRAINIGVDAASLGICDALEQNARQATDLAIDAIKSDRVQGWISDILASLNISSDTKGVDAGNAIAAGAGLMLSTTATGYGLAPASSANDNQEITNYIAYTQPLEDKYIALQKEDANSAPFDPENQYSLVGSIVKALKPDEIPTGTVLGIFSTLSNLYSNSFKLATGQPTASALYNQPSTAANGADGRYSHCPDEDLKYIGAAGDPTCSIIGVSDTSQLKAAEKQAYTPDDRTIRDLIDWMQSEHPEDEASGGTKCESNDAVDTGGSCADSQKASIDDNGKPIDGSQYSMWLKYCSDQRSASWGGQYEMSYNGSQRDQDWYSGLECMDRFGNGTDKQPSTMIRNFRDWTNYCLQKGTMDGASNCYADDTQALGNVAPSDCASNGDTRAIYTCALKYDNYRYKWGGGHGDVPNAQTWITDFKAGKYPEWTDILDCSGLVRMAFVEAMGIEDQAYVAPDGYGASKYWQSIEMKNAQQGDIVTSSGHVAIVESNDPAKGEFKIFEASTSEGAKENNIRHSTQTYRETFGTYRAKKG